VQLFDCTLVHLLAEKEVTADNFEFRDVIFNEEATEAEQQRVNILFELYLHAYFGI
jgi:hypothetical protein